MMIELRWLAVAVGLAGAACKHPDHETVAIAAAADLANAFEDLGAQFEAETRIHPVFTFGSTGLLGTQIRQGAPYALFAAAKRSFIDDVVRAGACDGATVRPYAQGRIVVWTAADVAAPRTLADLRDPRFERIAIANPEHAPYGQAAQQALEHAGVWPDVKARIVMGENVRAALQFAQSGDADAAIVALSLTTTTRAGHTLAIDPAMHDPIDQALVVCGGGRASTLAHQFADFLASPTGRATMQRYGFLLPGE